MDIDEPDYGSLPRREILMDWVEFDRLPLEEKQLFVEMAEAIERGQWMSRDGYSGVIDWACVDLNEYLDYNDFLWQLKKGGQAFYEVRKAEKRGYYSKFFDAQAFIGDVVAIDTSAPERQGKPMEETLEEEQSLQARAHSIRFYTGTRTNLSLLARQGLRRGSAVICTGRRNAVRLP